MKWDIVDAACVVCGQGFTPAEWDARHWPQDGGEAHAHCCPDCISCFATGIEPVGVTVAGLDDDDEDREVTA